MFWLLCRLLLRSAPTTCEPLLLLDLDAHSVSQATDLPAELKCQAYYGDRKEEVENGLDPSVLIRFNKEGDRIVHFGCFCRSLDRYFWSPFCGRSVFQDLEKILIELIRHTEANRTGINMQTIVYTWTAVHVRNNENSIANMALSYDTLASVTRIFEEPFAEYKRRLRLRRIFSGCSVAGLGADPTGERMHAMVRMAHRNIEAIRSKPIRLLGMILAEQEEVAQVSHVLGSFKSRDKAMRYAMSMIRSFIERQAREACLAADGVDSLFKELAGAASLNWTSREVRWIFDVIQLYKWYGGLPVLRFWGADLAAQFIRGAIESELARDRCDDQTRYDRENNPFDCLFQTGLLDGYSPEATMEWFIRAESPAGSHGGACPEHVAAMDPTVLYFLRAMKERGNVSRARLVALLSGLEFGRGLGKNYPLMTLEITKREDASSSMMMNFEWSDEMGLPTSG